MKYFIAAMLLCMSCEANVTVNTGKGTYTVGPGGCVE